MRTIGFTKNRVRALGICSIINIALTAPALTQPQASPPQNQAPPSQNQAPPSQNQASKKFADDTVIITLAPNSDPAKVKEILDDVHGTVIKTLHINAENYSILFVKPEQGKVDDLVKKLNAKKDKNIKAISRNGVARSGGAPNDPDYTLQWNLSAINWIKARSTYSFHQKATPHIIDLDSGVQPITQNSELNNVTQFNCINGANAVPEAPFDDMIGYSSAPGHGTACCDMYGAVTDNSTDTAGVASFQPNLFPKVFEFRVLDSNDDASFTDMITALTYIVNNQSSLGGPSAVNISIYSEDPPIYAEPAFATLTASLCKQGSIAVFCAGDQGMNNSQYSVGASRVVSGTDIHNKLGSGTDSSDYIGNNGAVAPGYGVPLIWGNHKLYPGSVGTSFASPTWAAGIAILQTLNPSLSAIAADRILYETAKTIESPPPGASSPVYKLKMMDLYEAARVAHH